MGWPEFSLLGRPLPGHFVVRVVTLATGEARPVDPEEWGDALVVVEQGHVEIEIAGGARYTFDRGAVLALTGMSGGTIRNLGDDPAVVATVRRRRPRGEGRPNQR